MDFPKQLDGISLDFLANCSLSWKTGEVGKACEPGSVTALKSINSWIFYNESKSQVPGLGRVDEIFHTID